jgi:hypothetical protein
MSVYQFVCFPLFGIPTVRRSNYLVIDRIYLSYLNVIVKLNCAYCAYANGLIGYAILYWCPIKHARRVIAADERYRNFVDYGDAESYRAEFEVLRL